MKFAVVTSALISAVLLAAPAWAAPAADNMLPGLGGYWRLKDKGTAKPVLTPWAQAEMKKIVRRGDVDVEAERWCNFQGVPYVMDNAGPIRIVQTADETDIIAERLATPRHIYFKLAKRPDPEVFDFTPVGNTVGKRVGDAVVADTWFFNDGVGVEGAPRTEGTKLNERFTVSKDGKTLSVASVWTDPKVFVKSYVVTWTYERLPDDYTAVDYYCDPRANGVGNYPPGDPRAVHNLGK